MTIQIQKPVAEEKRKALIFISNLRTVPGELYGFRFMRREPELCSVLTCTYGRDGTRAVLCPSNRLGMCNHHTKMIGGSGYRATNPHHGCKGARWIPAKTRRFVGT